MAMTDIMAAKSGSYWVATAPTQQYPPLTTDLDVDVAIVGGGIVGLTAAILLKRAGHSVAVLEARRAGAQTSGGSTAKITSQHSLIYGHLREQFGEDGARTYAAANQTAIERIAELVTDYGIECDFERRDAYAYTHREDQVAQLQQEADAARSLGLPASLVRDTSLPFDVKAALRFTNQAQFHPCKYTHGLAQAIDGDGSYLFENTRVLDVDDTSPCRVSTEQGASVQAKAVIVATGLPILDRGGYFSKAYPKAHLALAARLEAGNTFDGMFISIDEPTHSLRLARDPQSDILIAIGPSFSTGHASDIREDYRTLERFVRQHFNLHSIEHRWMNEDFNSADRVPYVGKLLPVSNHVYIATGFSGWGISNGTAAAEILADTIRGIANPWASLYTSTRIKPATSAKRFVQENLQVAKDFVTDHLPGKPDKSIADLGPDEGGIVAVGSDKLAAYKDAAGKVHLLSPVCTHLGCHVMWNNGEKTWDCPCHGSRFGYAGEVLQGPAVKALAPKEMPGSTEPSEG